MSFLVVYNSFVFRIYRGEDSFAKRLAAQLILSETC